MKTKFNIVLLTLELIRNTFFARRLAIEHLTQPLKYIKKHVFEMKESLEFFWLFLKAVVNVEKPVSVEDESFQEEG